MESTEPTRRNICIVDSLECYNDKLRGKLNFDKIHLLTKPYTNGDDNVVGRKRKRSELHGTDKYLKIDLETALKEGRILNKVKWENSNYNKVEPDMFVNWPDYVSLSSLGEEEKDHVSLSSLGEEEKEEEGEDEADFDKVEKDSELSVIEVQDLDAIEVGTLYYNIAGCMSSAVSEMQLLAYIPFPLAEHKIIKTLKMFIV